MTINIVTNNNLEEFNIITDQELEQTLEDKNVVTQDSGQSVDFGENNTVGCNGYRIISVEYIKSSTINGVKYSRIFKYTVDTSKGAIDSNLSKLLPIPYSLEVANAAVDTGTLIDIDYDNGILITHDKKSSTTIDTLNSGTVYLFFSEHPEIGNVKIPNSGQYCMISGYGNKVYSQCASSEGNNNISAGRYAHTEGKNTKASWACHAEGCDNKALGQCSHVEGRFNEATGNISHAEGKSTKAIGDFSHASGIRAEAKDLASYVWQGTDIADKYSTETDAVSVYTSHGKGTFNIKPVNGINGFYIDNKNLHQHILDTTNKTDYTAFEVFPTYTTIPAGTIDETTKIEYYNEVTPWNLFGLELKTKHLQKDSNIIIDWGDGKITDVKNTISDSGSPTSTIDKDSMYYPSKYDSEENEIKIEFTHKYETQGKYTVKIYGNTYWGIRAKYDKGFSNLISRIFEKDLPMASCVVNVSSLCRSSLRLQKIEIANYTVFPNIINISSIFQNCINLDTTKGFSVYGSANKYNCFNGIMYGCYSVFTGCTNLRFSDYTIPVINTNTGTTVRTTYYNCSNLSVDVLTLLPQTGFCNRIIDMYYVFRNCSSITCSDYEMLGDILWNDTSKKWINTNRCFTGCTSLDLNQIPTSWGGNK